MNYNIHYDIAASVITLTVMIHFSVKKNIQTRLVQMFRILMICTLVSSVLDMITAYGISYPGTFPLWSEYLLNVLYLIFFNTTAAIYFAYILNNTKQHEQLTRLDQIRMCLFIAVDFAVILTTPWSHLVIYFDEQQRYHQGPLMTLLYVNAIIYVIMALIQALRYRYKLTATQKVSVYFYTISSLAVVIIQMAHPKYLLTEFAVSISVLLIYLSLENPADYEDKRLGTYNRDAFLKIVSEKIQKKKHFDVLGIQVDGFKYINETIGVANGDLLLKQIAEALMAMVQKGKVFHISGVQFAVYTECQQENPARLAAQITELFGHPFLCGGMEVSLSAPMCCLSYPDSVQNLVDVIDTIEYSLKESRHSDNECVIFASEEILTRKRRETAIIQLMKQANRQGGYEVYYQPIYSVEKNQYTSAEALIRLRSQELGFVSPEEFIPLAEKNGLILEIGEFVFDQVCRFITQEGLADKGIEYIEVNLSVVQCMQDKLHETLLQKMDEYHVPYRMINLEITETAAVISSDVLLGNMTKLMEKGVSFSMDDYGTGFSNTSTVIEYPFSIIKFDKSMVWSAMNSDKAMCALKYNTAMFKEMNMHIVAEGVETEEQAQLLREMGCDYFQGYLYSKPVPEQEFLQKL